MATILRPQRWDSPFDPAMTDAVVAELMLRPEFAAIDSDKFPSHTPLEEIILNDSRVVDCQAGDIVVREGDYGNSAFVVLDGTLRVVLSPELPRNLLGRLPSRKKGAFETLAQLWRNNRRPEIRDVARYQNAALRDSEDKTKAHIFLQDVPAVLDSHRTETFTGGMMFGELGALGRLPRTSTIFAETDARIFEIRWQGLRDIRKFDAGWRRQIDENYRQYGLKAFLRASELFAGLDPEILDLVADRCLFETYGNFDWHVTYRRMRETGATDEPVIARQGDYPNGLLMIRAGFARVAVTYGSSHRTLGYLSAGDEFGLAELYEAWRDPQRSEISIGTSLSALGYVDVIRVPAPVLEEYVFPRLDQAPSDAFAAAARRSVADDSSMEWAVERRYINGTQAMLIDLDRCVRCDDCVRACAATHGGNPRFRRHGHTFDNWMVANACMHCSDPVCMIGCPTGAIHRTVGGGTVVINDDTCIGCGTCAASCPYDNIVMVDIRDGSGRPVTDSASGEPIRKATKCDLCAEQPSGPACVRACPHGALNRIDFRTFDLSRSV